MNELIKVTTYERGQQLISGRELHEFLEAKERYSKWFGRMMDTASQKGLITPRTKKYTP